MGFKIKLSQELNGNRQTIIMGIINVSKESFYKPSIKISNGDISVFAQKLVEDGADIIDIGGASTAPPSFYPDALYVSESVELKRVKNAVKIIKDVVNIPLSVDTMRAKVAELAVKMGVDIVNDVSGLKKDPKMVNVLKEYQPYVVLMASNKEPGDVISVSDMINSLKESINIALNAGLSENKIIIDPGFGFGKSLELNIKLLKSIHLLKDFNKPILVGVSRKSFIRSLVGDLEESIFLGSLAATVISVIEGANIIRTHDVKAVKNILRIVDLYKF
ncbi:MAG: dihydropteroate synthase [Candidatus Odinarchaeia archaeon]